MNKEIIEYIILTQTSYDWLLRMVNIYIKKWRQPIWWIHTEEAILMQAMVKYKD